MSDIYLITRTAIYDHGVIGVFTSLEDAKAFTERWTAEHVPTSEWDYNADGDGHHRFRIDQYELNGEKVATVAVWGTRNQRRVPDGVYEWLPLEAR